jgi:hypothetical protein
MIMPKNINSYYLGLGVLIVLLQLLYPPYLKGSYSYIVFLFGGLIINGGYSFLTLIWKKKENTILKNFHKQDLAFLAFLSNAIAFASFFYFFYLHSVVFANSMDHVVGEYTEEYIYRGESFYITTNEYQAMKFWEFSTLIFMPLGLIISFINKYK